MEESSLPESSPAAKPPAAKQVIPLIVAVVIAGAGIGYAAYEHQSAQTLATQNQQESAQLNATQQQMQALSARVNALATAAAQEAKPSPEVPTARAVTHRRAVVHHRSRAEDARFKKMQSQLDAQGKAIDDTRSDLASTRTQLTGSIAHTHDELVLLEKKGERNFVEFDISKSKEFKREGPISISLRKANTKHQFADLVLLVDDRNLSQKHVNLYQPAMFYQPDSPQPIEIVINEISKNHIHGYVSAPKYRQSELAAAANSGANAAPGSDQAPNPSAQQPTRQRLPVPSPDQP